MAVDRYADDGVGSRRTVRSRYDLPTPKDEAVRGRHPGHPVAAVDDGPDRREGQGPGARPPRRAPTRVGYR